jgi:hypothetical protein
LKSASASFIRFLPVLIFSAMPDRQQKTSGVARYPQREDHGARA